jgi:translation initiation factor 5B
LADSKIPVSGINIGPIHKKDIVKASVCLESNPEYAVILAFDVVTTKEAAEAADKMKVKIFSADIIYHLFDKFTEYMKKLNDEKKKEQLGKAVWPCILKVSDCYRKSDPLILGVDILEGKLKLGTPLCILQKGESENEKRILEIGTVSTIQHSHKDLQEAKQGSSVAISIIVKDKIMFGKQFSEKSGEFYSKISRESIDVLKEYFADEIKTDDKTLIQKLKLLLGVKDPNKKN